MESGLLAMVCATFSDLRPDLVSLLHFSTFIKGPRIAKVQHCVKGVAAPAQPAGGTYWKWGTAGAAGGIFILIWKNAPVNIASSKEYNDVSNKCQYTPGNFDILQV